MITQEQANYLLSLPKYIIEGEEILEFKDYSPKFPIADRIYIISKDDDAYSFFVEIQQSRKNQLKLTLHFQEDDTNIGLLRVDYNGRHKNPELESTDLPGMFKPYIGKWIDESHIHYFVEGYNPLVWAIPLYLDEAFSSKSFNGVNDFADVLKSFCNRINVETNFTINVQTKLL